MNSTDENQMLKYQRTLKAVADAAGSSLPYGVAPEELEQNINPNMYGVRCSDRGTTEPLPPNPFSLQVMLPCMGTYLRDAEASPEAVLKRARELNLQSLNAFPYNRDGGKF